MTRRTSLSLLVLAAAGILSLPSTAGAVQITVHKTARDPLTHQVIHASWKEDVAPGDRDDDGCPDQRDNYNGPGCKKPAPVATTPAATAPAPVTTSVTSGSASAIPGYITACESGGNYSAVNPSSGAYGAYQIMPSTASAYGCDLSTASGQDQCAASIYADVGSSAWSCG